MQKMQSSFRITLLLYLLVFILPFSFYFTYTSFQTIQNDTTIVSQSSQTSASMTYILYELNNENLQQAIAHIDTNLQNISSWVNQNDTSDLYVGTESLSKDFSQIMACWHSYKESLSTQETQVIREHALECWKKTNDFAIVIEKMVYLKQNKMINIFYLSLFILMMFLFVIIYFMRLFIHQQMKKHAIHDHETKLFNKTYFCAELKTSCARAVRNNAPLSLLSISIDDFGKESKHYSQKMQAYLLKSFGGLITSLIRESDVACRYDDNHFSILLPDTSEENALILEKRVRETLERHDFGAVPELKFKFATSHLHYKETPEAFIARIETLLQ